MDLWKDQFHKKSSAYLRYSKCESKTNHKHDIINLLDFMNTNSANFLTGS